MTASTNFDDYEVKYRMNKAREADVFPRNKASLFELLASSGIRTIVVSFDGSGDSGQIESIDYISDDGAALDKQPGGQVEYLKVDHDTSEVVASTRSTDDVITSMTYSFLQQTHDGWEDNEGAYGEITFAVADRTIKMDFNQRFTDSANHQHDF